MFIIPTTSVDCLSDVVTVHLYGDLSNEVWVFIVTLKVSASVNNHSVCLVFMNVGLNDIVSYYCPELSIIRNTRVDSLLKVFRIPLYSLLSHLL